MTINEITTLSNEMITIKENTSRYREQAEKLEQEIKQLEKEVSETLDFEKDMELQDKKEYLPKFKRRLIHAEKNEEEMLKERGNKLGIIVSRYHKEQMENNSEIENAYNTAQDALTEAYKAVQAYEQARETHAQALAEEVAEAGYDEAVSRVGIMTYNSTRQILGSTPTQINLKKGVGNGRFQNARDFFEEVVKETE